MRVAGLGNLTCRTVPCAASRGKWRCRAIATASGASIYERPMSKKDSDSHVFNDHAKHIQLGDVRIGADGAAEMDEERPLVSVPRGEIVRIEGIHAVAGERPVATLVIGLVLLVIAIVPVVALVDVFVRGGTYYVEWIAAVACIIPAGWLIQLSLRRRWLLLVTTSRDRRKLLFPAKVTQVEVETFVAQAKARFGYS